MSDPLIDAAIINLSEHSEYLTEAAARNKRDLTEIAKGIADNTCLAINHFTPASVSDMPYARQYTLEEVIRLLKERV